MDLCIALATIIAVGGSGGMALAWLDWTLHVHDVRTQIQNGEWGEM